MRTVKQMSAGFASAKVAGVVLASALASSPSFAQFAKATQGLTAVQTFLTGAAVILVTIAFIFAGAEMMFKKSKFADIAHIFWGAIIIGGAAGFAAWAVG